MTPQALQEATEIDLRSVASGWENFNLYLQEFQVACRYMEWERAECARNSANSYLEVSMDAFMGIHKRLELVQRED